MGAATAENTNRKRRAYCGLIPIKVAAATTIYKGGMVFDDGDGFAVHTAGKFLGVARDEYDNSAGADGDVEGEVYTEGVWTFNYSTDDAAQTLVGTEANAANGFDCTAAATARLGLIVAVPSASEIEVKLQVEVE